MSSGFWLGFDLGGTGVRLVVVDEQGIGTGLTMQTQEFNEQPLERICAAAVQLMPANRQLLGIGIGSAGPIDLHSGEINNDNSLPQFSHKGLGAMLARRFEVPVWIDNDAVAAGLAEFTWGLPASPSSLLCVTLGTGVGVAMIDRGRPVRGADGQHPEAGHLGIPGQGNPCYCGLEQCWEQLASRAALDRLRTSWTADASSMWREYASHLAAGLLTLITVHRPQVVVISGSVARYWGDLERPLKDALAGHPVFEAQRSVFVSTLGPYGGASGATRLATEHIGFGFLPDGAAGRA